MKTLIALILLSANAWAQPDKPVDQPTYYRVDFLVKELEAGKTVNSRAYSMTVSTERGANSSIRTGSRVPIAGKEGGINYMELGISFDCRSARAEGAGELAFNVNSDISSVAEPSSNPPVIRNNRWSSNVIIPLRKPTVIFSSDDAMSKRQMQLEVTATPIK